ncbi:MAG TPA: hypothetical protein VNZ44_07405 [Pyrinomonadaceae bacterium]|nr:hypothetical protein [Pyrinomonadaceae bacterium]
MTAGFSIDSIKRRHGRFVRSFAVLLLLYTGADLAMPQYFCGEEIGGMSLTSFLTDRADQRDGVPSRLSTAPEAPRPEAPNDQTPHDEDCFCCCMHILPALPVTNIGGSEIVTPSAPIELESFPAPPLGGTFHPPRLA